jgi:hypothetical protein
MTLQQALAIARQHAKPHRRAELDKLSGSNALAKHVADVAALGKSYATMGSNLSGMTARLAKISADVALIENHPNAPWRLH